MSTTPETAPKRGSRLPRLARRAQLLEAAQEVFVANGYHAAAMDDIADRAGVSKPVLYQHFPGKLELYLALLDTSCDAIVASVRDALKSTDDNKQRVAATMHAFYDYVANAQGAFRLVFESDLTNEPAVRERVDRVTHACAEAVSEVISADAGLNRSSRWCWPSAWSAWRRSAPGTGWPPTTRRCPRSRPPTWSPRWPGAASAASPAPTPDPSTPSCADAEVLLWADG